MYNRIDRINEQVKKELSELIRVLKDPRIPKMISVTASKVTKDLKYAKAYISVLGTEQEQKNAILGLQSASGFIRKEIGQRVGLRNCPEFTFVLDNSIAHGMHISEMINEINQKDGDNINGHSAKDSPDNQIPQ